jgi:hypothetical protein
VAITGARGESVTDEEITRFALQLREAERIRAQIARDEAARAGNGEDLPPAALPVVEQPPASALAAA